MATGWLCQCTQWSTTHSHHYCQNRFPMWIAGVFKMAIGGQYFPHQKNRCCGVCSRVLSPDADGYARMDGTVHKGPVDRHRSHHLRSIRLCSCVSIIVTLATTRRATTAVVTFIHLLSMAAIPNWQPVYTSVAPFSRAVATSFVVSGICLVNACLSLVYPWTYYLLLSTIPPPMYSRYPVAFDVS